MEEIDPLLFVFTTGERRTVIGTDQYHRYGPRHRTPWTGWTYSVPPRQVTVRRPSDDIKEIAFCSTAHGTVIEVDGKVPVRPNPAELALQVAQNVVDLEVAGDLPVSAPPTFVGLRPSGETFVLDATVRILSRHLSDLPHFQVQVAQHKYMTLTHGADDSADKMFIANSWTKQSKFYQSGSTVPVSAGLFLPFEIRLDRRLVCGVLKLQADMSNRIFGATIFAPDSLGDIPCNAGTILRRTVQWNGKGGVVTSSFEFGEVLSLGGRTSLY